MPIRVKCPHCESQFTTSRRYRGSTVRCPRCSDWIKIRSNRKKGRTPRPHSSGSVDIDEVDPAELSSLSGDVEELLASLDSRGAAESDLATQPAADAPSLVATEASPAIENTSETPAADNNDASDDTDIEASDCEEDSLSDEIEVPLEEAPDFNSASQQAVDFLAASGGAEAALPGAEWKQDSIVSEVVTTEEPIDLPGETNAIAATRNTTSDPTPRPTPPAKSKNSPKLDFDEDNSLKLYLAIGGIAAGLLMVSFYVLGGMFGSDALPAGSLAGKPPVINLGEEDSPFAEVQFESTQIETDTSLFGSGKNVLTITIHNAGEIALDKVEFIASVTSGLFDTAPLAKSELSHQFSIGLQPGESEEFVITPASGDPLAEIKLPSGARVAIQVTDVKWVGK